MSKLVINRNTFLEKEEVTNLQSFLQNSVFFQALMAATYSFGIISNNPKTFNSSFDEENPLFIDNKAFEVTNNSTVANTVNINTGLALTSQGNIINLDSVYSLNVPANGVYYWIKIGYATRRYEQGTVSVNLKGAVSGSVSFNGKVRGQSGKTPVSIRFTKTDGSQPLNNGTYEIAQVIDDKNIMLASSTTFVAENNLRVIILGTIPLGKVFTSTQLEGLYEYDFYEISLVQESTLDTAPTKDVDEYYLARVVNNDGTITIDNTKKTEYWTLANFKQ